MSKQMKGQLVYKTVQSITLPAQLEAWTRVRTCPREVLDPTAEFLAVRGRVEGRCLKVVGEVLIQGTLVLTNGRLWALKTASSFGLEFSLSELVQTGHMVIEPQVVGLTYSINQLGRKQAEVKFIIPSTFAVKVMAVQPCEVAALLAHCHFRPAFLPVVVATQVENVQRELLLPLDPPGRKIIRADISEQGARSDWALPLVASGTAQEEILYLGTDGHMHELCHATDWNYLWPTELKKIEGEPVVAARGEIIRAEILSSGHTLSLSIRENIELQVCQERKQDILLADDDLPPDQIIPARIPLILAEQSCSELVPACLALNERPTVPGRPQVKIINLGGRADHGQVILQGQLEIAFPYVDHQGRERLQHVTSPLTKVLVMEASRPGQLVQVEGRVESVQSTITESGNLELQTLCAFHARLLALENVALVAGPALPKTQSNKLWVRTEQLVGQQSHDLLLEEVMVSDKEALIFDHSVHPQVQGVHVGYGTLFCRGEIQVSVYYLSASQEECCRELSLPWQATLNIPAAEPQLISDVNVQVGLLPLPAAKDSGQVVVRAACTVEGRVYRSAVVPVITELLASDEAEIDRLVKAAICQEAELEVLIKPRGWWSAYGGNVSVEVQQVSWQVGQGQVVGIGELSLAVTYAQPQGVLQKWQEVRPFELTFACPQAELGLDVCGELKIQEVLYEESSKNAQGPMAAGRCIRANVVLVADLVLL